MSNEGVINIIKLIWPLIVIQLALQIYAIVDVVRAKRTKNLSSAIWIIIIILGEILGPIAYLLVGKSEEN